MAASWGKNRTCLATASMEGDGRDGLDPVTSDGGTEDNDEGIDEDSDGDGTGKRSSFVLYRMCTCDGRLSVSCRWVSIDIKGLFEFVSLL